MIEQWYSSFVIVIRVIMQLWTQNMQASIYNVCSTPFNRFHCGIGAEMKNASYLLKVIRGETNGSCGILFPLCFHGKILLTTVFCFYYSCRPSVYFDDLCHSVGPWWFDEQVTRCTRVQLQCNMRFCLLLIAPKSALYLNHSYTAHVWKRWEKVRIMN